MKVVLAAYVLAAALLPLGHHDIACHLKSTTHCTTCVIGSSAELVADASVLTHVRLTDAGGAAVPATRELESVVLLGSAGRSPPAAV